MTFDRDDDFDLDNEYEEEADEDWLCFGEADCGRWVNGRLTHSCRLLGTEDCDFECPLRGSL